MSICGTLGTTAIQGSGARCCPSRVPRWSPLAARTAPGKPETHYVTASPTSVPTPPAVAPHGGVDLDVLVVTDGTPPVEAIGQQLTTEGIPSTVINLHDSSRKVITRAFLARTLPGGSEGGNFEGIVLPGAAPSGLSAAEEERAGLVRAHVPRAPGGRLLSADARHRDEPAGLQRAAQRHYARDQGWGECGVRLPQRVVPVQRGVGWPRAVRLPRRARTGRRRHAAAQRGDPGLVRQRHAGVAVRQPGARAARNRLRLRQLPGAVPLPGARHRDLGYPRREPRRLAQLPRHRLRRHVPRGLAVEPGR